MDPWFPTPGSRITVVFYKTPPNDVEEEGGERKENGTGPDAFKHRSSKTRDCWEKSKPHIPSQKRNNPIISPVLLGQDKLLNRKDTKHEKLGLSWHWYRNDHGTQYAVNTNIYHG